jgi:hypothetical protein
MSIDDLIRLREGLRLSFGRTEQGGGKLRSLVESRPMRKPPSQVPIVLKFVRCYQNKIGIMVDANLDCWNLDDLRRWAACKISFIVIDSQTGEDITRVLLA